MKSNTCRLSGGFPQTKQKQQHIQIIHMNFEGPIPWAGSSSSLSVDAKVHNGKTHMDNFVLPLTHAAVVDQTSMKPSVNFK